MSYNPWNPYYGYYQPNYFYCHPGCLPDPPCTKVANPPPEVVSPSLLRSFESCMSAINAASSRQSKIGNHIQTNITRNSNALAESMPKRDACETGSVQVASPILDLSSITQDADEILGPLVQLCKKAYPEPRWCLVTKPPRPPTPPRIPFKDPRPSADAIFSISRCG